MKLISYKSTQDGFNGIANILIRFRLRGQYSHNEIMFEPGDGVDHLMPDGTCEPVDGAYWCVSSVASERMPAWSRFRPGKWGGVRFKRIVPKPARWDIDPVRSSPLMAAYWARKNEGRRYDWRLILGFVAWIIPQQAGRLVCSEACAEMLGLPDAWRFDPCSLVAAIRGGDHAEI